MTGDATIVSGRRVAERYRLEKPRGNDAWDAVDETLRRSVVVHLLRARADAQAKAHFTAEARTLARLNHRNVVATYDTGVDGDGTSYRVEELPGGEALDLGAVDNAHRLSFATQLAQAFADAHAVGLVHGSLTSASALVNDEGRVRVRGLQLPPEGVDVDAAMATDMVALLQLVTALAPPGPSPLRDLAVSWRTNPPASAEAMHEALVALPEDTTVRVPGPPEEPVTGVPPRRPARLPVLLAVGAVVVAAVAAAILLPSATNDGSFEGPVAPVALTAKSFDPEANPPTENEAQARFAVDDNPRTSWMTDRYRSANFSGLKDGVGLVLQPTSGSVEATQVVVTSPTRNWTFAVYVADKAAADLAGWGQPRATTTVQGDSTTLTFDRARGEAVLLWITNPGPSRQVRITDVSVLGRT